MNELMLIVAVVAVVWVAGSSIKKILNKTGEVVENIGDTTIGILNISSEVVADTAGTYAHEAYVSNAEKRAELKEKYAAIGSIVTIDELNAIRTKSTGKK